MKTINVYLETKDPDYSFALSNSLLQNNKYFSIQVGSPIQEHKECDIYLTDDMNALTQNTVYLTEDPALETVNIENSCYILHKYQHVNHISNILRLAYSDYAKSEMLSDETEHTNIVSICSSSGGTGCTSVALGLCQELVRFHGKRVLYISLEDFESTSYYFPYKTQEANNITKYVYHILNKKHCCHYITEGYMLKDEYGIFAFHPAKGRNPLCELTGNEFVTFINHITSEKIFSDLILDCGNGFGDSILSALQLSVTVFKITGNTPDFHRSANYLSTMSNRLATKDVAEMIEVSNFYFAPDTEDGEPLSESDNQQLMIEEDSASFDVINGRRVISLDKMFGQGIRDLVQHLILPSD